MVNKSNDVIKPKIIVVPMLRNVEETMAGITNRNEKGLKIPPVKERRALNCNKSISRNGAA